MPIKAVIFDIGNVLVEWHPRDTYDRHIGPEKRRELFDAVDLDGMNLRVDLGGDFKTEIAAMADAHPAYRDLILMWETLWLDMLQPYIPHSAKMLRALRTRGMPVYALTNFGTATLKIAEPHYPVLTEFDIRFISGDLKMIKPDPALYAHVEAHVPQSPDQLLFIDDRADNIDAAAARGWQTHLFDQPGALADRLIAEGLLSAEDAAP